MNTHHPDSPGVNPASGVDPSIVSSERRSKPPVRGMGYGDIFSPSAKTKPLPADPPGERLVNPSTMVNALKQIPKKLPPPAPSSTDAPIINDRSPSSDQAPALPPRPVNQFNPHLPLSRPPLLAHLQQSHPMPSAQQPIREQARVVYAYQPLNEDELAMEVGDIINVLDKKIEDVGWWRGELKGKIGVFPDNFVELIEPGSHQESWQQQQHSKSAIGSLPNHNSSSEAKFKSVFAGTPKGFSKELEGNLEKHNNNPVSFLSLKRNKLNQQLSLPTESTMTDDEKAKGVSTIPDNKSNKLNHITANRAKGPNRRPPSNVQTKRAQTESPPVRLDIGGQENETNSDNTLTSYPISNASNNHPLSSVDQQSDSNIQGRIGPVPPVPTKPSDGITTNNSPVKTNVPAEIVETPKISQRITSQISSDKNETGSSSTPPWMVELKKTHAEKKNVTCNIREPPIIRDSPSIREIPNTKDNTNIRDTSKNKSAPNEIAELRQEVKQLQESVYSMTDLKDVVDIMKTEIRECQSAIENQRRYIKELVNNLADERRRISAMQAELNKN